MRTTYRTHVQCQVLRYGVRGRVCDLHKCGLYSHIMPAREINHSAINPRDSLIIGPAAPFLAGYKSCFATSTNGRIKD